MWGRNLEFYRALLAPRAWGDDIRSAGVSMRHLVSMALSPGDTAVWHYVLRKQLCSASVHASDGRIPKFYVVDRE